MGDLVMAHEMILTIISTLFSFAAIYYSFILSKETSGAKYWIFFLITAIMLSIAHIVSKDFLGFSSETQFVAKEVAEIAGMFSLAYATYGLHSSMKKIREKVGKELEE